MRETFERQKSLVQCIGYSFLISKFSPMIPFTNGTKIIMIQGVFKRYQDNLYLLKQIDNEGNI